MIKKWEERQKNTGEKTKMKKEKEKKGNSNRKTQKIEKKETNFLFKNNKISNFKKQEKEN